MLPRLNEIFRAFLKLGCISFGGPIAHLGYFREEFVQKRCWLSDTDYADLVALCQFLPGPASSQVVFGLGMRRGGLTGALLASLCFTLPSALLMILFGYGMGWIGAIGHAGWLQGLKIAATAVVAQALCGMAVKLTPDMPRICIGLLAALGAFLWPGATGQLGAIVGGGILGWVIFNSRSRQTGVSAFPKTHGHRWAIISSIAFCILLLFSLLAGRFSVNTTLAEFAAFYRSGSLVFGGGHVVMPLLQAEVVPRGWVSDNAFLAGYGVVQALPGPLFTFAAYLGTVSTVFPNGWMGGLWCLFAIYLPTWLLIGGALPFWERLRGLSGIRAALCGTNAAVVGILLAAFYNPIWIEGIRTLTDFFIAGIAFIFLRYLKMPAWLLVILCALAGQMTGVRSSHF